MDLGHCGVFEGQGQKMFLRNAFPFVQSLPPADPAGCFQAQHYQLPGGVGRVVVSFLPGQQDIRPAIAIDHRLGFKGDSLFL